MYTIFGFLDVWGQLPVNFFLKDDLGWSPSQVSRNQMLSDSCPGYSLTSVPDSLPTRSPREAGSNVPHELQMCGAWMLTPHFVQLEFWGGLKALPWVIKPVYGILSDAVPLLGYHRRSYLIVFGLLGKRQSTLTWPNRHMSCF